MFSLVADYDITSSSSSDEDDSDNSGDVRESAKNSSTIAKPSPAQLLPSANTLLSRESSKPSGDVFNNPFLEAEKLEIDKLQKHVKMVESENHLLEKNGRKICWNNRKGRCRFGNKCKYAHDSDLVEDKELLDVNKQTLNKKAKTLANIQNPESCGPEKAKGLKRPGLGDSIAPGKRVMKSYNKMKKPT